MKQCEEIVKNTEKGNSEMITFDFMQNIPLTHIPISEKFYVRQVWFYVFGIHRFSEIDFQKIKHYCTHMMR